jgi:AraC family transcriptional regulator of adaptative response/methylated-DNA-[protein]-cysteine methyltransferase
MMDTMKERMMKELTVEDATMPSGMDGPVQARPRWRDAHRASVPALVTYAVGRQPEGAARAFGSVLIARSGQGVCAILLGEEKALLEAELAGYFPQATLQEDAASLGDVLTDWWAFVETPSQGFRHALHIRGTPMQQQVWEALRTIPPGSTLTYTELAARVGRPQAVRAVASACAANRLAVVIPCHRVIGRSGSLTGYRWGIDRKRGLLDMEARR